MISTSSEVMIAALIPAAPLSPVKVSATKTSIEIAWNAPASDGGAAILNYNVYSNNGGGSIYTLVGTSAST
jgi:predicted phage tail protein